jgi:hypothetical protein
MNKIKLTALTALAVFGLAWGAQAQIIGTPFQWSGGTYLISTNSSGGLVVSQITTQGTNTMIVPVSMDQAMQVGSQWLAQNNPANISYYSTNEIIGRVGAAYLQNSGQAVVVLEALKYGLFGYSNIGISAGILQGNNGGKSGTAGEYAGIEYRKPIGDVAFNAGLGGGYDQWNTKPFGFVKAGMEYRQSPHMGEWLSIIYAFEKSDNSRGLIVGAGVEGIF